MAELQEAAFRLIRESLLKVDSDSSRGHFNLVCDPLTLRILGSICKMSDLYELGVTSIENIVTVRQPNPNLDAFYFLSVERESIQALLKDFGNDSRPQHSGVHLVFCGKVDEEMFKQLAEHKVLAPRVKSFKEAGLNFVMFQQDAFHLAHPNVAQFFNDTTAIQICTDGILHVCDVLKIRPTVRYAKSGCCSDVAKRVYDTHQRAASIPTKNKSTLLIVDRSVDIQAALLHQASYEALIYDVVPGFDNESGILTIDSKKQLLHDASFQKLKYLHFLDVRKQVQQDLAEFSKKNVNLTKVQQGVGAELELSDMISAIRGVPEFQEQYQAFESNLSLVKIIMEELENRNVIVQRRADNKFEQNTGSLEAELATGITDSMKEAKIIQMTGALTTFFANTPNLPADVKLRLILLYLALFNDVSAQSRQTLMEAANLPDSDHRAVLKFLELSLAGSTDHSSKSELRRTKTQLALAKKDLKSQTNIIDRFTPRLKTLMERLIDNLLDTDNFPGFGVEKVIDSGAGNDQRAWGWKNVNANAGSTETSKPKLVVFIIGGVTLCEIRVAQELMKTQTKCDILIGGTCILTPKMLLDSLRGKTSATGANEVRINVG
eukprot:GEMP01013663.1.p1 GENE.GEMP01013663.1~~GEMP01013663.1.p1  ORF type:complete len:606 (+),score=120.69 GEMP01013663.1:86-1903(+)